MKAGDKVRITLLGVVSDHEPNPDGDYVWVWVFGVGPTQLPVKHVQVIE
jgi:hypothetical protein